MSSLEFWSLMWIIISILGIVWIAFWLWYYVFPILAESTNEKT